jgi:hypothetical protein
MMKFVIKKYSIGALMMSAAILAGCGGGGGDDGSTTPATLSAITITYANAPDVAANAVSASAGISQSGDIGSLVTGVTINSSMATRPSFLNASLQQIYTVLENQPSSNLVAGITTSRTVACTSGSISGTVSVATSGVLSNGDSLSLTANSCYDGTSTINGNFTIVFSNLSGTPNSGTAWSGTLAMTFKNLRITTGSETEQVNGDMTVSVTQRGQLDADASISGNSLQLVLLRNGATVLDRTLSAYAYHGTVSSNLETYSDNFTVSGNLKGAGTGSLTVATSTLFKQITGAFPHEGVLKVTGASNTSVILTALDNTNVRLDIDKNGDGAIDETVTTTWATLAARI